MEQHDDNDPMESLRKAVEELDMLARAPLDGGGLVVAAAVLAGNGNASDSADRGSNASAASPRVEEKPSLADLGPATPDETAGVPPRDAEPNGSTSVGDTSLLAPTTPGRPSALEGAGETAPVAPLPVVSTPTPAGSTALPSLGDSPAPASVSPALPAQKPRRGRGAKSPVRSTVEESVSPARSMRSSGPPPPIVAEKIKIGTGCGLVTHKDMELHTSGVTSDPNHPESPLRIIAIMAELTKTGLAARCTTVPPRKATEQEIRACHHGPYVDLLLTIPTMDSAMLFATAHSYNSVYLNNQSLDAALWSAGCVAQMAEHVWTGKIRNGFAVVRPPGHHAESHQAMGFCLLDNVAIAARMLIQKFKVARILIIDWDVHHGNGIQQLFYSDPQVLYVSLHRFDNGTFFPVGRGGAPERIGEGKGLGRNMNIGWPSAGMKDGDYLYAFTELIMPVAYEFDPDIVIVASGFDAAEGDPLGGCHVSPAGYHQLTHLLSGLAQGKLVVALEGGYNVKSISRSAAAVCSALLGDPAPRLAGPSVPSKGGMRAVEDTMRCLAPYWKCLKGKVPAGGASLEDAFGGLGISS